MGISMKRQLVYDSTCIITEQRPLMTPYITGYTALSISWPDRIQVGWHTTSTFCFGANFNAWRIAGVNYSDTSHILGGTDIHDVSGFLEQNGVKNPPTTLAAGYERATFDMLYHHLVIKHAPVPNIQSKDIDGDGEVDFDKVARWIHKATSEHISVEDAELMKSWFEESRMVSRSSFNFSIPRFWSSPDLLRQRAIIAHVLKNPTEADLDQILDRFGKDSVVSALEDLRVMKDIHPKAYDLCVHRIETSGL